MSNKKIRKNIMTFLGGLGVGIVNGLLGAGGGMLATPLLKESGLDQTETHATSVAAILPISAFSAALYLWRGDFNISDSLWFLPFGAVGAVIGALILPKISEKALRKIFAGFMLWAALRILYK